MMCIRCRYVPFAQAIIVSTVAVAWLNSGALAADLPRCIQPNDHTGSSAAVVVGDWPLLHTTQILPADRDAELDVEDASSQITAVLDRLTMTLIDCGSDLNRVIKLNFYVADDRVIENVSMELSRRFAGDYKPAVSFVVTPLPQTHAIVAVDAVAATSHTPGRGVQLLEAAGADRRVSVMPGGTRVYVSGQAERDESLADATRKTLQSLRATLQSLGRSDTDIVQLKAFMQPMTAAAVVEREVAAFFADGPAPPLVLVGWQSAASTPIEIELIAWGGAHRAGDAVEYVTPPAMKASPVFSRVARVNQTRSIYLSALRASPPDAAVDRTSPEAGEHEVTELFTRMQDVLRIAGSGLQHLVKATYYVSTDSASSKLNELRPNYYDAARPPAASKARVASVGDTRLGLSVDMIAVPAFSEEAPEYGPPEYGHGLNAVDAAAGWISLFDGATTFGWKDAKVIGGELSGGETTVRLGNCELRATFASGGTIEVGGIPRQVATGTFRLEQTLLGSDRVLPIRVGDDVRLKQLAVRPLGLQPMFNGVDLSQWNRIDHPRLAADQRPAWRVEEGVIRTRGGPGCLEYQGGQFGDMVFQIDVRTRIRHANGGVFFRAIPGDLMNGYEAQIYNRGQDSDPNRPATWSTGGIDDRVNARRVVSRDNQFFRMTIIANGPHIATWVNGFQQTDLIDTRSPHVNPRLGRRTQAGVIQIQAHDAGTDLEFKNVLVLATQDEE